MENGKPQSEQPINPEVIQKMKGMFPVKSEHEFNRMIEEIESWSEQDYADAKRFLANFADYLTKWKEIAVDSEKNEKKTLKNW